MNIEQLQNHTKKGRQNMTAMTTATPGGDLLTLNELATRLRLHPSTVRGLWRRRVFPGLIIGHRTLRFEYAKVLDALRQATK